MIRKNEQFCSRSTFSQIFKVLAQKIKKGPMFEVGKKHANLTHFSRANKSRKN